MKEEIRVEEVLNVISRRFRVVGYRLDENCLNVIVEPREDERKAFNEVYGELVRRGYIAFFERSDVLRLKVIRKDVKRRIVVNVILFFVTTITVLFTGFALSECYNEALIEMGFKGVDVAFNAVLFTVLFLGALGFHELGHLVAAKINDIPVTLPYFIPAPPPQLGFPIGSLGAVIGMMAPPRDRNALFDMGALGPIFGFVAATAVTIIGLLLSVPVTAVQLGRIACVELRMLPLAFALLLEAIWGGQKIVLHPIAFAGWFLYIVTFLNMLPVWQLDGGHVLRALVSAKTHMIASALVLAVLVMLGKTVLQVFAVLVALLMFITTPGHPGCANEESDVDARKALVLAFFAACLILSAPIL